MNRLLIRGPTKLTGEVLISGSKNAVLPILFATLLTTRPVKIENVPCIKDVEIAIKLLVKLGTKITCDNNIYYIDASDVKVCSLPYNLVRSIRASIWMLAPLVARFGYGEIYLPGGCSIGSRPIDLHINILEKMGASVRHVNDGYIKVIVKGKKLRGTRVIMKKISVGATVTGLSAASLAQGTTIIENAACEPEVVDVANFLIMLGSNISGVGSDRIIIEGVHDLGGGSYKIIPDRIETGTYLIAGAISRSYVICRQSRSDILLTVLDKLRETGADIQTGDNWISLDMHDQRPRAVTVCTAPYPGFPTDLQAQFSVLNLVAEGMSMITETVFEKRFAHVPELKRMGACAEIKNNTIICHGVSTLFGTQVMATDLRASVSLVLAGCIAHGITVVEQVCHIDRGYDSIEKKLSYIGACIKRIV